MMLKNPIFLILHGRSGNAKDMNQISLLIQENFPSAIIAAPNGQQECIEQDSPYGNQPPFGRQWYDSTGDDEEVERQMAACSSWLVSYLNSVKQKHSLSLADVVIVGYSQGAILTLSKLAKQVENVKAIFCIAGMKVGSDLPCVDIDTRCFLIHCKSDQIVPYSKFQCTCDELKQIGCQVEKFVLEVNGHSLSNDTDGALASLFYKFIKLTND